MWWSNRSACQSGGQVSWGKLERRATVAMEGDRHQRRPFLALEARAARGSSNGLGRPALGSSARLTSSMSSLNTEQVALRASRPALVALLVVMISMQGFGVIVPLLPFYARSFHAPGWQTRAVVLGLFGRIVLWRALQGRALGPDRSAALLVSTVSANCLYYLALAFAPNIFVGCLVRFLGGFAGGNGVGGGELHRRHPRWPTAPGAWRSWARLTSASSSALALAACSRPGQDQPAFSCRCWSLRAPPRSRGRGLLHRARSRIPHDRGAARARAGRSPAARSVIRWSAG